MEFHQHFGYKFYDPDSNEYEITMWSHRHGKRDEDGNPIDFVDQFPLKNFSYDEVWLSPQYAHYWTAEDLIVITIQ